MRAKPALRPGISNRAAFLATGSGQATPQDAGEEIRERVEGVERQDVRDTLIGPNDDERAARAVDPAQVENIPCGGPGRTEYLLVTAQAETALERQQQGMQGFERNGPMWLLQDGAQIDDGIGIPASRRMNRERGSQVLAGRWRD